MEWIDAAFAWLGDGLVRAMAGTPLGGGALESLLVQGVLGGVGSVLSFLPQILILFFFIAVLEGCGYMARAAYLMDKVMVRVGLKRQVVHSASVVVCLRDTGHHGHAGDRRRARPADHDPGRPADDLLGPAAGLYAVDRGVHPREVVRRRAGESARARARRVCICWESSPRSSWPCSEADAVAGRVAAAS